eukprot:1323321-Pyramimonas_sp.AAC.1
MDKALHKCCGTHEAGSGSANSDSQASTNSSHSTVQSLCLGPSLVLALMNTRSYVHAAILCLVASRACA